ncbi:MATE family efflux transporter [Aliagarivorans marinus]|uniref:MATE family efflux transporter n=1 Tax=Aliagarivorans marinus TaxID=561965 RepID=UPI000428D593|nr:MATE family efflux transporter [Aliagarivorans marinus]
MSHSVAINQTSFLSNIVKIALPVAIHNALVACLGMADVIMVAGLGEAATAAVGAASRWHFVMIMIMAGLANASGTLIAQYWGKGSAGDAKAVSKLALKVGIWLFVPITLLVGLGAELMMNAQTTDAQVIAFGRDYLITSLPILLLTHVIINQEAALRSTGQSWLPLGVSSFVILLNISLNFVLINGLFGVPAMGVKGAALATVIARVVNVAIYWVYVRRVQHWLVTAKEDSEPKLLHSKYRRLAVPQVINLLGWGMGTLMLQIIFGRMGTTELAIFSLLAPFEGLCYSLFFGLATACAVLIGQSLGRSEFERAEHISGQFLLSAFIGSLVVGLVVFFNLDVLLGWLHLDSPEMLPMARPVMLILAMGLWVRMLNMMLIHGILRAGGENLFCLRTDFIGMWLVGIPVTAYGAFIGEWPFYLCYLALFSDELTKLTLAARHYLRRGWCNNLTLHPA